MSLLVGIRSLKSRMCFLFNSMQSKAGWIDNIDATIARGLAKQKILRKNENTEIVLSCGFELATGWREVQTVIDYFI